MISMIEHIEYLMLSHDCVVVPGFGAFIAQYTNSHKECSNSTFTSPERNISFNASITHNDGLLANSIAKKATMPYAEALNVIEHGITVCKQALNDDTEVPFGHLGYFINNSEGHMEFVPFHHKQANDDFFGLRSFSFPTLAELTKPDIDTVCDSCSQTTAIHTTPKNWFGYKVIQIAASIIVLVCLSLALTTPIIVDQPSHQMATMNIPTPTLPKHKTIKATKSKPIPGANDNDVLSKSDGQEAGKYAIIICSLKKKSQADLFFRNNKDITPSNVVKKNGFYMIYYRSGNNYKTLLKEAKKMPKAYKEFWITKI